MVHVGDYTSNCDDLNYRPALPSRNGAKMRLPKTVNIGGKHYKVTRDGNLSEGHGSLNTQTRVIMVGSANRDPVTALDTYIHEVMEVSLIENHFRFNRDAHPDDSRFEMTHPEFCRFADDVAGALRPMLK